MAIKRQKSKKQKQTPIDDNKKGNIFWKIFFLLISILLFLSLVSQHSSDLNIINGGREGHIQNLIGITGAFVSRGLLFLFGFGAYIFSLLFLFFSIQAFFRKPFPQHKSYLLSFISLIIAISILFGLCPQYFTSITEHLGIGSSNSPYYALSGGVIGQFLAAPPECGAGVIRYYTGTAGTVAVAMALLCIGIVFLWNILPFKFLFHLFQLKRTIPEDNSEHDEAPQTKGLIERSKERIENKRRKQREEKQKKERKKEELKLEEFPKEDPKPLFSNIPKKSSKEPLPAKPVNTNTINRSNRSTGKNSTYKLPPVKLLKDLPEKRGDSKEFVKVAKETLQDTLNSFGIDAQVTDAVTGPRVTRLEVVPSPGVRVQRISSLESNIKLDLKAESIRILAPIPGKDAVGIEIPNKASSMVALKSIFQSKTWGNNPGEIPIILGKDVAGEPVITDLARAPHLLIAGATGSGKSVCVNTLIMSLLYRFSPEDLRLILVDPKVVEFEMYQTLPHLITPIVNEPKKVPLALRWGINEMERRYRILAKVRVKNLEGFNSRQIPSEPVLDDEGNPIPAKLPFIVIIIDELADIMMIAKADVETSIARIAQKARAVGIHLVLATQRPSVQIITGVIKANLPTRIAFRVTSVVDSRVILDHKGAETLLGRGDMLFIPPGSAKLDRIQGAMISDPEIEDVVSFCAVQMEQEFDTKVMSQESDNPNTLETGNSSTSSSQSPNSGSEGDIIEQAIDIIRRERKASTSYLQRRLKIGYNRAAEIIDILESKGVIGPQIGSARREIFIDTEEN